MFKILASLVIAVLAIEGLNAASGGELYVASLKRLAQETEAPIQQFVQPEVIQQPTALPEENGGYSNDYVDPQEVKDVVREIKDLKSQLKRLAAQAKKSKLYADDLAKVNALQAELDGHYKTISNKSVDNSELREAIQEFRDNNYWDEVEKLRLRIEFPKEAKQINLILKRIEKLITQKTFANLGLNFDKVAEYIAETRQLIDTIQGHLAAGEIEEAVEVMHSQGDRPHPGEIEGTMHRIRDIKQRMKRVKDTAIRAEIDGVLQDVIDAFNAGEYRDANETLNEYADDLLQLIDKLTRVRWNQEESFSRIRSLEELINSKLQQMDAQQEQQEQAQPPSQVRF